MESARLTVSSLGPVAKSLTRLLVNSVARFRLSGVSVGFGV